MGLWIMITEPIQELNAASQLLTVSNLSVKRSIDDAQVLKNVSIGISATQKVGIVGESGSGKTTLVNAIIQQLAQGLSSSSGEIVFNDRKILPGDGAIINGMMGNLGIAIAALMTGWIIRDYGWRAAFWIPGLISLALGWVFWRVSDANEIPPVKKMPTFSVESQANQFTLFFIMTLAATTGSFLFNFTTNGNNEVLLNKLGDQWRNPAVIGTLLAAIYCIAAFSQLIIGALIDRVPLKKLYSTVIFLQLVTIIAATQLEGWSFYIAQLCFMCAIFAAIPFTDAMIAKYIDDSMRSRFSGARFAISFGVSSIAVWLIGPIVKTWGFSTFLWLMAATSAATLIVISFLPKTMDHSL